MAEETEVEEVEEVEVEEVAPASKPVAKKAPAKKKAPVVEEPTAEVVEEPITVVPETKRGRIKGTWRMYFNGQPWDFVDGDYYDLPQDLYHYLRANGNIYDTLR